MFSGYSSWSLVEGGKRVVLVSYKGGGCGTAAAGGTVGFLILVELDYFSGVFCYYAGVSAVG
jgi:hypothetical protein